MTRTTGLRGQSMRMVNKAGLAEFFGVSVTAVDAWIRRGCPVVHRGGLNRPWCFDLLEVMRWRFDRADTYQPVAPDDMTPQDRRAWYDSEKCRLDLQARCRELIPLEEVEHVMTIAVRTISRALDEIPDKLEATGAGPAEVAVARELIVSHVAALTDNLAPQTTRGSRDA